MKKIDVILVFSGCYSKNTINRVTYGNKGDLFLLFLEAGKSMIKMLVDLVSGKGPLPGS